jgi:hypothetical protein
MNSLSRKAATNGLVCTEQPTLGNAHITKQSTISAVGVVGIPRYVYRFEVVSTDAPIKNYMVGSPRLKSHSWKRKSCTAFLMGTDISAVTTRVNQLQVAAT